jgi:small subunit ribosomal protein S1
VELAPQIEGLLHITELGRDLKHANQAVAEGDEVFVVVERVDKRARRITLSRLSAQEMADHESAQAAGAAEAPRNLRVGSRIKVVVSRVESRGLVVRVAGVVGKRARGYVPSIELGERAGDLRKTFPVGAEIEVKIVGIDRDGGLRCSPKALAVDDERRAVKDYRREAAKQGFGTFGDLLRAKLGQADPK